jgi:hypothetical protein
MTHDTGWFKSTYSDSGNPTCVEVKMSDAAVGVRDSKGSTTDALWLTPTAWAVFRSMVTDSR